MWVVGLLEKKTERRKRDSSCVNSVFYSTFRCRLKDSVSREPTMPVFDSHEYLTEEERRLKEDRERTKYWKKWGSYVAERQWATGEFLLPARLKLV